MLVYSERYCYHSTDTCELIVKTSNRGFLDDFLKVNFSVVDMDRHTIPTTEVQRKPNRIQLFGSAAQPVRWKKLYSLSVWFVLCRSHSFTYMQRSRTFSHRSSRSCGFFLSLSLSRTYTHSHKHFSILAHSQCVCRSRGRVLFHSFRTLRMP